MFSLIVAIANNNVIGLDNKMPWHYPNDLKYFKETTLNHKVVMGYNTYMSILDYLKKPFSNRQNIILSFESFESDFDNVFVYDNLESLIEKYKNSEEEVFVAGGMTIYEQMLEHCERLYITHINKTYPGDAFFPTIDFSKFTKTSSKIDGELEFCVYERKKQDD